jgi:hypothetical protein
MELQGSQWNSKATIANSIRLLASIRFEKTTMALSADSIIINQYKEFIQSVMSSNHTLSKEQSVIFTGIQVFE